MDQKDLISVIIPIYNGEKFVNRAVSKLQHQTYKNIEILLIPNNCTDNTVALCNAIAQADSRVKVFDNPEKGPFLARRRGVMEAKGKYILMCDVDDYYASNNAIEQMYKAILEDQAQIVQFGTYTSYYGLYRRKAAFVDIKTVFTREELLDGPLMSIAPGRGGGGIHALRLVQNI